MLQQGGNEIVNGRYLAKYNSNEVRGRMRMPSNNSDLNALRSWIQYKYVDKIWFMDDGSGSTNAGKVPEAPAEVQTAPPGRRKIINAPQQQQQPQEDLFGGGWDAFGEVQAAPVPPTNDFADFGAPAVASPVDNNASFQADFGSQQPTMVNMPPQQQQPFEANFDQQPRFQANFDQQPQQQSMFDANFNQASQNQQQIQQQQNQQMQSTFQANFDQPNQMNGHTQQQMQPSFQANFDQPSQLQQQQMQPSFQANFDQSNQMNGHAQQQMLPSFQANFDQASNQANQVVNSFGNFDTNQNSMRQDQANVVQQGMFTANFDQTQTHMNQTAPATKVQPAQQQPNMFNANFNVSSQTAPTMNGPKPASFSVNFDQPNNAMMNEGMSTLNVQQQITTGMNQSTDQMGEFNQADVSQSNSQTNVQQSNMGVAQISNVTPANQPSISSDSMSNAMNPNAFRSIDDDKKSAFDAFEGLSLEPSPGLMEKSWADDAASSDLPAPPMLGDSDANNNHLTVCDDAVKSAKVQEISTMLKGLSLEHLLEVQKCINSLSHVAVSSQGSLLADSAAQMKRIVGADLPQQMMANIGANGHDEQTTQQFQQNLNPGIAQMQPIDMDSAANPQITLTNNGRMNGFMNQQPMGVGSSMPSSMNENQSVTQMPITKGGVMDFNNQQATQSQTVGMGSDASNDIPEVPTSALPPVEKEGNPFDMY